MVACGAVDPARQARRIEVEIVKRSDRAQGFELLPKPLDRRAHHRLAQPLPALGLPEGMRCIKDWENLNRKALAFLRLASIRLMLRRLCNPS